MYHTIINPDPPLSLPVVQTSQILRELSRKLTDSTVLRCKSCQGTTRWGDSACADCPGFLVPALAGALASRTSLCFMAPFDICLDLLPTASLPPVQNRIYSTSFATRGGTHQICGTKGTRRYRGGQQLSQGSRVCTGSPRSLELFCSAGGNRAEGIEDSNRFGSSCNLKVDTVPT